MSLVAQGRNHFHNLNCNVVFYLCLNTNDPHLSSCFCSSTRMSSSRMTCKSICLEREMRHVRAPSYSILWRVMSRFYNTNITVISNTASTL